MELLDSNWEYDVDDNCLYQRNIQLDKLDRSKVYELANYDLTKLFEIYDQIDIKPETIKKLKDQELKSRIINKLKELRISYEIKNIDTEFRIYLPTENLSIIIDNNKTHITEINYVTGKYNDYYYESKSENYVYLIKWHDGDDNSNDHILITEDRNDISFAVKDKYLGDLFRYFDIPYDPKERFLEQNWWKFNTKFSPKNLYWHETFTF